MSRSPHMEQQRHELLSDIAKHTEVVLKDHGIEQEIAEQAGTALADWLATHWGGQMVTIPKDYFFKLAARDMKIYHQFNGNNHSELARLHKMSVRGIYKLLDRVHKREIDRRQCRLDLDPDEGGGA